jgi:type I restriction enzyme R subunit
MSVIDDREKVTQERIIRLFRNKLEYTYIGDLHDQNNSNIIEERLSEYLRRQKYSDERIRRSINALIAASRLPDLYQANQAVYTLLRYGASVKEDVSSKNEPVNFINWKNPFDNDFLIAQEVTVTGMHTKRPDLVLYINGIAVCVLELKRSSVSVSQGIRQNLDNQKDEFIGQFFSTVQFIMAGNDTEGLRYGVIKTHEKYFMEWKEEEENRAQDELSAKIRALSADEEYKIDQHLVSLCQKERLIDFLYYFIVFDGGDKKTCRHNQYFGIVAARERITKRHEGGIIWHSQGSGKSLTMVWLSRWIKENNPNARVLIVTDREELDDQIENKVFGAGGVGDKIYRTTSCADLIAKLNQAAPNLMCSLIHKFGKNQDGDEEKSYAGYIKQLLESLPPNFKAKGEFYVFVDECHRTQSGKLHKAMSIILPDALFVGFTGTPLLSRKEMAKRGIKSSIEIFGSYIHTYKYDEAVKDKVVLDLRYEARDIPQDISSPENIDAWFEKKTKGLTDLAKAKLKQRWGTLKEVYSSKSRLDRIVADIVFDMEIRDRLNNGQGNAMLVASSIYEACQYYKLFQEKGLDKCAIITSYSGDISEIKGEETGEARKTENLFKYDIYKNMLAGRAVDIFEKEAKEKFIKEPAQMQLLIVVDKLLTGFDAPKATYLYIDKSMKDHGLFQAICRVNRLDTDDKEYGYIIDYMDLFQTLKNAISDYTSDAFDGFEKEDIDGLLKNRLSEGKKHLLELLESLRALCEPVKQPRGTIQFIRYFCWEHNDDLIELEENEPKREKLYQFTASLIRAYADIAGEFEELGFSEEQVKSIRDEVRFYKNRRDDIRLTSGDYIDLKKYEADMRYLLDNYINAGDRKTLSALDDMSLIELIVERGVGFESELPEGLKNNPDAAAEAIENNIRRRIIEKRSTNPLYYEKMSVLLVKIIEDRKNEKAAYKKYLERIVELSRRTEHPEEYAGYPPEIKPSPAMRALYDNLPEELRNVETVLSLHDRIIKGKPDKWIGENAKEKAVLRILDSVLHDDDLITKFFEMIKQQPEYR